MSSRRNRPERSSAAEAGKRLSPSVSAVQTAPDVPPRPLVANSLIAEERIRRAAYLLAEQRGFTPGHELDDWLEAERSICGATGEPSGESSVVHKGRRVGEAR